MDHNDRQAIERLFSNLGNVERQSTSRDHEAEQFIGQRIASQPGAPYFMAQTIVVQEQALEMVENRIAELEHALQSQPRQGAGGFFASLFGSGQSQQPAQRQQSQQGYAPAMGRQPEPEPQPQAASPWARQPANTGAGGGFLAGAAQTAMGVAGGVMLGNALGSMFGGSEAKAAEPKPEEKQEPDDDGGDDDEGFDLGF